jgi:2-oxoglutarate ferredoxin oxidoreductase subunit beta
MTETRQDQSAADNLPDISPYLRLERMPYIWCSGCGIGVVVSSYLRSVLKARLNPDKVSVVSGIGCSGKTAGYIKLDSFQTAHGRAVPFAEGLVIGNPDLNVTVISGDGDLVSIGGNHLIHAARRNINMTVICINNFNYGMTGGQMGSTTPMEAMTSTTPYGNYEYSFNLPSLLQAAGAPYIARWTTLQTRQLESSITEALVKPGFKFIEVITPCPIAYGRSNKRGKGLDHLHLYEEKSVVQNGADTRNAGIEANGPIIVGKFLDIERPTFFDNRKMALNRPKQRERGGH